MLGGTGWNAGSRMHLQLNAAADGTHSGGQPAASMLDEDENHLDRKARTSIKPKRFRRMAARTGFRCDGQWIGRRVALRAKTCYYCEITVLAWELAARTLCSVSGFRDHAGR